jgi:hypothetical protein
MLYYTASNGVNITSRNILTYGNSKVSGQVAIWSTMPIITCPGSTPECRKSCYAMKAVRRYPSVERGYTARHELMQSHRRLWWQMMLEHIDRYHPAVIRAYGAGDIMTQRDVDMWNLVAALRPRVHIYGYTKSRRLFDFAALDSKPNVNFIDSFLPDGEINFGHIDSITDRCTRLGVKLCPVTQGQTSAHCMTTCKLCLTERHIGFIQH